MSPYSAGILAHFSSQIGNVTSLLTGGMPNLFQEFAPPEQYVGAFRESYKLVRSRTSILTWDTVEGAWYETPLSNLVAKPRKVYDRGLDTWEEWFTANTKNFENLHRLFTAAGAGDVTIISVSLEDTLEMPNDDKFALFTHAEERGRIGLVM